MKKSWFMFILGSIGALVVGLWLYRKINPAIPNGVERVPSGGAGSQSATTGGYRRDTDKSTIEIGPITIRPMEKLPSWTWDDGFDPESYR